MCINLAVNVNFFFFSAYNFFLKINVTVGKKKKMNEDCCDLQGQNQ